MDPHSLQLGHIVELLEEACFETALNNTTEAKKACFAAIKLLNGLLKEEIILPQTKPLLAYSLELYNKITSKGTAGFSFGEKLLWLGSKMHQCLFPPILCFENFTSLEMGPFSPVPNINVPKSFKAVYKPVSVENWTFEREILSTLYQDLLSNCSFVSAFLSIVASGNESALIQLVWPRKSSNSYKVSLNFNGCQRVVLANNELPFIPNSTRNLVIRSAAQRDLLWPAILEKAFLAILGNGYDFEGSNMAADIFVLTGWIPEIVLLKSGTLPENMAQLWDLHSKGKITLGLGTGNLSPELSRQLNLITDHDYVVENYDPVERKLHIKNPWATQNEASDRIVQLQESELVHVSYFYVNWDPLHLFKFQAKVHFINNVDPEDFTRLYRKPQFSLQNTSFSAQEIWLLLEKHLPIKEDLKTHIKVYQTVSGERVLVSSQYPETNKDDGSSNTRLQLVKLTLAPKSAYTVVIVSSSSGAFTMCSYNNIGPNFGPIKAKDKYANKLEPVSGEWKGPTLGGNWLLPSYVKNPQFDVEINSENTRLDMALFSSPEKAVNMHFFFADKDDIGVSIRNFDKSKLVFSNDYTASFQHKEVEYLQKGHYKLVLSCFDNETAAKYDLYGLFSGPKDALKMTPIDSSLGLFLRTKRVMWNNSSRIKVPFTTKYYNTALTFHITHENSHFAASLESYRPAIRGSVFDEKSALPLRINELWNDSVYGVFVDCVVPAPTTCILLIERLEPGMGSCTVAGGGATAFDFE